MEDKLADIRRLAVMALTVGIAVMGGEAAQQRPGRRGFPASTPASSPQISPARRRSRRSARF